MHKHHWILGMTTLDGTPAYCRSCGDYRLFRTSGLPWESSAEARRRPGNPEPTRVTQQELPFNPHGQWGSLEGNSL